VGRRYVFLLVLTAAIWGASYMFIKVAGREIEPIPMMALRLVLAAAVLFPIVIVQRGGAETVDAIRRGGRGLVLLGLINSALPFTLIAWGETHVTSSVAAIANAPVPIFVALLAIKFRKSETVTGMRLVGIVLGFVGVGILTGLHPEGGWWAVAGTLAVVGAALSYAFSNLYAQGRFAQTSPIVVVAGTSLWGALMLIPLALFQLPSEMPSAKALASVAMLGMVGTAFALILYFKMLQGYGSSRASLVTYLIPLFAVIYGVTILDESLHANAILGLAFILGGVALGSGALRYVRRREPAPAAPRA
jgi:drug/metabolite transporter (DMT)-like permease